MTMAKPPAWICRRSSLASCWRMRKQDDNVLRDGIRVLAEALMESEATGLVGTERYERSDERTAYRNGRRPRTQGSLTWRFRASDRGRTFPRGCTAPTAECALRAFVQEAYVHGVLTRKAGELVKALVVWFDRLARARFRLYLMERAEMMRHVAGVISCWVLWGVVVGPGLALAQYGTTNGEWPSYGGDLGSTTYAPLDQIDATNFGELEIAWRWQSVDGALDLEALRQERPEIGISNLKATPLMVGGVLFLSTPLGQAVAIDAGTGQTLWVYDSESYLGDPYPHSPLSPLTRVAWRTGPTGKMPESCGAPTTGI